MQKVSSHLKRKIHHASNIHIVNNTLESMVLRVILYSFGFLALVYVLLLVNMVRNIVERRSLELAASTLSSQVGNMELTYLSMSNNIDLTFSYSLGFKAINPTFATRKTLGMVSRPNSSDVAIAQNNI